MELFSRAEDATASKKDTLTYIGPELMFPMQVPLLLIDGLILLGVFSLEKLSCFQYRNCALSWSQEGSSNSSLGLELRRGRGLPRRSNAFGFFPSTECLRLPASEIRAAQAGLLLYEIRAYGKEVNVTAPVAPWLHRDCWNLQSPKGWTPGRLGRREDWQRKHRLPPCITYKP